VYNAQISLDVVKLVDDGLQTDDFLGQISVGIALEVYRSAQTLPIDHYLVLDVLIDVSIALQFLQQSLFIMFDFLVLLLEDIFELLQLDHPALEYLQHIFVDEVTWSFWAFYFS
jgi:hypothetical protein